MVYRKETLEFWDVFYRTCHGSGLLLMSGKKNAGQVRNLHREKGKYDLTKHSFNFAVPDVKTVIHHVKKVDKFLYAGILNGSFNLIDNMKQYIPQYDAKRIASELQDNNTGDVDL